MSVSATPRLGMVGKAPCQADFLRIQASSPLAHQFLHWLSAGVEAARAARCGLPSGTASFLFTVPGERNVLAGVFSPSVDGVGRAFPLAVFTELAASALALRLSLLPLALRPFLLASSELLRASASMDLPELTRQVGILPPPDMEDFVSADRQLQELLAGRRGVDLLAPLSHPEEALDSTYYALHTFRVACTGERHRQDTPAHIILECPLVNGLGPAVWLELAAKLLRWTSTPPAFAWSDGAEPRLLLCLGTTAPELFLHLARPGWDGSHLWPLRTTRAAAIEHARRSLSETQRRHIDSPTTPLEALLHALS
ncbi:MAG TPA: type VI secretion system-associated protein TagF [Archangium sp.]|uniref:type VI secretion system-associated protein TagF n=1 Tax=Archangium sp. TaxID=1872627 RepID=UPI002E3586FE|nr:type VI secretion system-associated protein TagF [Archangium sp.]HEX5750984.1 type VI secretion system-associated protein TagF [Archangium sp.]